MIRLLFDHNLSPKLVRRLADLFPDSEHVYNIRMDEESDIAIRLFAAREDYVVVTFDSDYYYLNYVFGHPPKVIWLRFGNSATDKVESILRENLPYIEKLVNDKDYGILELR